MAAVGTDKELSDLLDFSMVRARGRGLRGAGRWGLRRGGNASLRTGRDGFQMGRVCAQAHVRQLVYFQVKAKPLPLLPPPPLPLERILFPRGEVGWGLLGLGWEMLGRCNGVVCALFKRWLRNGPGDFLQPYRNFSS